MTKIDYALENRRKLSGNSKEKDVPRVGLEPTPN